jgi:hypothetical protein
VITHRLAESLKQPQVEVQNTTAQSAADKNGLNDPNTKHHRQQRH